MSWDFFCRYRVRVKANRIPGKQYFDLTKIFPLIFVLGSAIMINVQIRTEAFADAYHRKKPVRQLNSNLK
uniref:Uncharacterized protein n=1 Tax=Pseudonaja textilis TaxID=8673 RepID=A0A670Y4L5_PSETE